MLSFTVHEQLAELVSKVHVILSRVRDGATIDELRLRLEEAKEALDSVQIIIGASPTGHFNSLARHLHFLLYYYERDQPENYQGDISDLYERDLPGVINEVHSWLEAQLDPRLLAAITTSWTAKNYANAVRDAFICLETELRSAAELDPTKGHSGEKLVSAAFDPKGILPAKVQKQSPIGELTAGEMTGLQHLVRGAFLLFRNSTAHRPIVYNVTEAEAIINVVNHCLRFIPNEHP